MFGSFSISEVLLLGVLGLLLIGIHRLFGRSSKTKAAHPSQAARSGQGHQTTNRSQESPASPRVGISVEISVPKVDESLRSQCSEIGIPLTQIPPACPSCAGILNKAPGKKTPCPRCGAFMYVRTRPKDSVRVLVTEGQAKILEEERLKVTGRYEAYQQAEQEDQEAEECRERTRQRLRQRFGKEPSDADVEWGYLNELRMRQGLNNDWQSYRDTTYRMANQLIEEGKSKGALAFLLEVCFYDLNGPRDCAGHDAEWMRQNPPFNPVYGRLQSAVMAQIQALALQLGLGKETLKDLFLKRSLNVPHIRLLPDFCWTLLESQLNLGAQPPGYFDGRHYTSCIDEVKALKRESKLDQAAELLLKAIEATEAEAKATGSSVSPGYFRELAIVYRKQKNYLAEQQILERYLGHVPHDSEAKERLKKVQSHIET